MRRGYILIEASVVYVILAMALTALLPLFILCFQASQKTGDVAAATLLSTELLEEIRLRQWDQTTPKDGRATAAPSQRLGPDPGENAADKRTFNDIDDFNQWSEKPPLGPGMEDIPALAGFWRNVVVEYVTPEDPDTASKTPTSHKRVTVCTHSRRIAPLCLQTLWTNR